MEKKQKSFFIYYINAENKSFKIGLYNNISKGELP